MTERDPESGRFKKGSSGNPGGRPKMGTTLSALIDEVVTLADWRHFFEMQKKKAYRGDQKALEVLLDRRFGKAVQQLQHAGEGGGPVIVQYVNTPYPITDVSLSSGSDPSEPKEV